MAHQFPFSSFILDNLPIPQTGFDVVQDLIDPRLRMYITSRGVKTFFVRKRINGNDKRIIIANYPDMDVETARDSVDGILSAATAPKKLRRKKTGFDKIVKMYLGQKVRRSEDSYYKLVRSIDRHLSSLLDMNVQDITPDDVTKTLSNIEGVAVRNRLHELLTSIFKFSVENGYIDINPATGVNKAIEQRRVRPLNKSGFERLLCAIKKESDQNLRSVFLMLIYGFAPKSKIFSMKWRDLDFNQYTWNGHPLSDAAVVLLTDMPQDGIWVFPGRGGNHLMDPRMAWKRIADNAKIPDLTMDDVYKYINKQLVWAGDREDLRANMNSVLEGIL